MFSKNLRYYRLKKQLTKKVLAELVNVSPMAITNYEDGSRKPNMDMLAMLAKALDCRISDFLAVRNKSLVFKHGEFRKSASLTKLQQDYIRESAEEYFSRFMTAVEVLGGEVLPDAPSCKALALSEDDEENALKLRRHMGFADDGPIEELIGKLENKGILVFECKIDSQKFSGMNGFVGDRPYIVLNPAMSAERNRSTVAHELAHLMFAWPGNMQENDIESKATSISGAFLFPKSDAVRELGVHRTSITKALQLVAKEFGISMMMLTKRAELCQIIGKSAAKSFYYIAGRLGWRTNEPSRIEAEHPGLFEQLVYRAVNEKEISVQRGAELLQRSYSDIAAMSSCYEER